MFNVIVDTVGFKSVILGFVFFLSCLLFFPFSALCIEDFFYDSILLGWPKSLFGKTQMNFSANPVYSF